MQEATRTVLEVTTLSDDRFEYFDDKAFSWTGILTFYKEPFKNKKGKHFEINILIDRKLESLDIRLLNALGKDWSWGEDRRIKAFKLISFSNEENLIHFTFETIRKSNNHDEIKYFLFDLGSYLNLSNYQIQTLNIKDIS